ncbi:urea carboxylase, partial [Rhodococcus hoagii]|nr:urea carboxylase [Prescottella equi]
AESIAEFEERQGAAFEAEKRAWHAAGEFDRVDAGPAPEPATEELDVPPGAVVVEAPMVGNVWRVELAPGQQVSAGDPAVVLEAMKLEMPVPCPVAGTVLQVLAEPGAKVAPGTPLAVIG